MDIMRQPACLFVTPITIYSYYSSLVARLAVRPRTQWRPCHKALIGWLVPDARLKLGPPYLNLVFSLALTICESWALFVSS